MTTDFLFRTEDIKQDEILDYLVESSTDRAIVENIKSRSPIILKGSRGVGKSFLLRVAEAEMLKVLDENRVLPVYVTFARATLIANPTPERFLAWMLAKLCNRIIRALSIRGLTLPRGSAIAAILGGSENTGSSGLESIESTLENSWRVGSAEPVAVKVPGPEDVIDAVQDVCEYTGLSRIVLLIDEAAHVFLPEQQRQFFTLMRDLRSPYLSVKAAVYPGATAFGEFFQPGHDATVLNIDRSVTDDLYASSMREIVLKQDTSLQKAIENNGDVFDTLAYAATGNPRILLKTLARSTPFSRRNVQDTIRRYYRQEVWSEHSGLADRYPGHRDLIDWGRQFLESWVLPELHRRNVDRKRETSSHIWIHRDAPHAVRESLRLLCYSGILQEGVSGVRASRSEIGTRYMVNLGCQFAVDAEPLSYGSSVRKALSVWRVVQFGPNHHSFKPLAKFAIDGLDSGTNLALEARLSASSSHLDLTAFQHEKLAELGLHTIRDVLTSEESTFRQARWIGEKRARQMRNAAVTAVLEYLSG